MEYVWIVSDKWGDILGVYKKEKTAFIKMIRLISTSNLSDDEVIDNIKKLIGLYEDPLKTHDVHLFGGGEDDCRTEFYMERVEVED